MSTIPRTIRNIWRSGLRSAFWQYATIGDVKAGRLVGVDRSGNKFYQNDEEELPLRTRWVEYNTFYPDAGDIDPGWHAWMSHMNDNPPSTSIIPNTGVEKWGAKEAKPNTTFSRGAYRPYSTVKSKITAWEPKVAMREDRP